MAARRSINGTADQLVRSRLPYLLEALLALLVHMPAVAQNDQVVKSVQLDEVVISAQARGFSVEDFIRQVQEDSTFHKAFLNTRFHPNRVRSEVRVWNKGEKERASAYREGRLLRDEARAQLVIDSTWEKGRLRDGKGGIRYLTVEMYDDVFFPKGPFTANNTVAGRALDVEGGRFERYKSELKKFMFDPGTEIASVPFIGKKLALFSPEMAPYYDFRIWADERNGHICWVFSADAKPEFRDGRTVIKTMDTWFDQASGVVLARQYRIANASLLLDFDISIKVENLLLEGQPVPVRVDYDGVWDIPFKKAELVRFWLVYSDWKVE